MENARVKLQPFSPLTQEMLVIATKTTIIMLAIVMVFFQDLAIIFDDALQSETTSYILAIPFLVTYLVYRKRKMIRAVIPLENLDRPKEMRHLPTIAGIILSTTAILLYWYGSYTFNTKLEYHMFALPIFAAGLILVLFNAQTLRQLAFPIAFLIFLTPPPSEILYALGSTLSVITSSASYTIISSLGIPSTLTNEYGNPIIQITRPSGTTTSSAVDIACSGIHSLIGFLIFAVFITYIIRDKPWKKLALFLIGFSLIYILNITRITTILLIGYHYGEETALQLFHLLGGWFLIFIGTLLLLIFTEKILRTQIFAKPAQKCIECNPKPETNQSFCITCGRIPKPAPIRFQRTGIIKMAAVIVSVILLISIQAPVFALTEGPAQIIIQTPAGEQGNTQLLPQIQGYTLKFIYRDTNFEEKARQDASLLYAYLPQDETKEKIWVQVEIGSSTSKLHDWEVCLISWQYQKGLPTLVTKLDLKDILIQQNPPINARYFAFQWVETNQTQVVLYWRTRATFKANDTAQQKHVKISLITLPDTPQNITKAENLLPFAKAIANYWQPIETWSQIALLISQKGIALIAITVATLATILSYQIIKDRKEKKSNLKIYNKLALQEEKLILQAAYQASKKEKPTANTIASQYQKLTGKTIKPELLIEKLNQAEKAGLTKREITSKEDEPTIIWQTQISLPKSYPSNNRKGQPNRSLK